MKNGRLMKCLVIAACVLVAAFFIYKAVDIVSEEFDTVQAEMTTVYDSVDVKAYIVRDETVLYNNDGGSVVVSTAKNAEKVTAASPVALTFSNTSAAENYLNLAYLNDLLEGYKKIDSQLVLANVDTDVLSEQIDSDFDSIISSVYTGDIRNLSDKKLSYLVDISKRQISFGKNIDCDSMIAELTQKIAAIESSSKPKSTVFAGQSGYYVSRADGMEKTLPFSSLENITVKDIENAFKAKPVEIADNSVGKIVSGFNWYLTAVVPSEEGARLEEGKKYKVIFGNNASDCVEAVAWKVIKEKDGKTAVVLSCNNISGERLTMRTVNAKIVLEEHSGLKIPKSAVRVIDENSCVFVRVGRVTKQRNIDVIYTGDDFVISDPKSEKVGTNGIKNHDAIIMNGKGLGSNE